MASKCEAKVHDHSFLIRPDIFMTVVHVNVLNLETSVPDTLSQCIGHTSTSGAMLLKQLSSTKNNIVEWHHTLLITEKPNVPNTAVLYSELTDVYDWYTLGLNLGVQETELQHIQRSYSTEGSRRWKQETISLWLRQTPGASWENVVKALQKMGENKVAEKIELKYIPGSKFHSVIYVILV